MRRFPFEFHAEDFGEMANEISWIAAGRIETCIRMNANDSSSTLFAPSLFLVIADE